MADSKISLPSGFGGIVRYNEESNTKFNLKPTHVIMFVVLLVVFRIIIGIVL